MIRPFLNTVSALCILTLAACDGPKERVDAPASEVAQASEVNVYSARHYESDQALFAAFEAETGVKVNVIEAQGDALIERLASEGAASPADLFVTADAGILWRAAERGVLQPIADKAAMERAPAQFRGPDDLWVGLSKRARIVVYDRALGLPEGFATYQDLASPALRGAICVRSSTNIYNQSLLASIIAHAGEAAAEEWARGVVANFARPPQGNDAAQIEAVAAGVCRVAVVNSYYLARFVGSAEPAQIDVAAKVAAFFPNQETTGTHVNISGVGVARYAPHTEAANRLIAFLLSDASQSAFASGNNEYPVVQGVAASGPVTTFGAFREDELAMGKLGEHQAAAVRIFDRVGWN